MIENFREYKFNRAIERQLEYQTEKSFRLQRATYDPTTHFQKYADQVKNKLSTYIQLDHETQVLEVGSGAHGLIFFLGLKNSIGIDPLADHYKKLFRQWQNRVRTITGEGENLPFSDGSFDLVISDNVVDHAANPYKIICEIERVLKPGGIFYFTVHVHHPIYDIFSRVYAMYKYLKLPFEIGPFADHTFHFTLSAAKNLFTNHDFTILSESNNIDETKTNAKFIEKRHLGDHLKRLFFKNATYEVIAKKRSGV